MYGYLVLSASLAVFVTLTTPAKVPDGCEKPVLENGSIKTSPPASGLYSVGSTIRIRCDRGYFVSNNFPACQHDGTWTALPECNKRGATCKNPFKSLRDPTAEPDKNSYSEGDTIKLRCKAGFTPSVPNAEYTCSQGTFGNDLATCIPKICRVTNIPEHMSMERYTYLHSEEVTYSCGWGFRPSSVTARPTCRNDGKISPQLPNCERAYCRRPKTRPGTKFYPDSEEYEISEQLVFRCEEGYYMEDDVQVVKCLASGEFSADIPTCIKTGPVDTTNDDCPVPRSPQNGLVILKHDVYLVGDSVDFACDRGYRLIGAERSYCEASGSFEPPAPTCEAIYCSDPPRIENGYLELSDSTLPFGSSAEYFCDAGFRLSGSKILYCQSEGYFEPQAPVCTGVVTCRPPSVTEGVTFEPVFGFYEVGKKIVYSCEEGYEVTGSGVAHCQDNGLFYPDAPNCQKKATMCNSPETPNNGSYSPVLGTNPIGVVITYTCDPGFVLIGPDTTECLPTGLFSEGTPECADCSPPRRPRYGRFRFEKGGYLTYLCNAGFEIQGSSSAKCVNGKYTPGPPRCIRASCSLSPIANGRYEPPLDPIPPETTVNFFCDTGYKLRGAATSYCGNRGNFTNPPPKCIRTCKIPTELPVGIVTDSKKKEFLAGEKIYFKCSSGRIFGSRVSRCRNDGKFYPLPKVCKGATRSCSSGCNYDPKQSCQCDGLCSFYDNCCPDRATFCESVYFTR